MPDYTDEWAQENTRRITSKKTKAKSKPSDKVSEITDAEFMIIGAVGIANDLCDWVGLDLLLFRALDLGTAGILGLWCLIRLRKFPSARFGGTFLIELIPGLGDISPTWTIFIISLYAEQKGYMPESLSKLTKGKP